MTPIKSLRAKCLQCCCDSYIEVKNCLVIKCPLYPYRLGHRPKDDNLYLEAKAEEKNEDSPLFISSESEIGE